MLFEEFIQKYSGMDPWELSLKKDRLAPLIKEDITLALNTLQAREKLRSKVPQWYSLPGLWFPLSLSAEQCSSSETASIKSRIICEEVPSPIKIADLTGGLGVDSWAFSKVAQEVLYNEMNPSLAKAAEHNFKALGADNISVSCKELVPGSVKEILSGMSPDILFLDPARRSAKGSKVFRLKDCSPDVTTLEEELLKAAPRLVLKLSPMADISLLSKELHHVKYFYAIESASECKEILAVEETDYSGPYGICAISTEGCFHFTPREEAAAEPILLTTSPSGWLFVPGKALSKAGAFKLISSRFGLRKLHPSTHLYTSEDVVPGLRGLGKWYRIQDCLPLDKSGIKEAGKRFPKADVSTRNLPLTSEELRRKLGLRGEGDYHIFGVRTLAGNLLIIATFAA